VILEDVAGFIAIIGAQAYIFVTASTAIAVQLLSVDRLPHVAQRLVDFNRITPGRMHLLAAVFWAFVAAALCLGVLLSGLKLQVNRDIAAGAGSILLDGLWLAYLIVPRDRPARPS
jgi:hypothetical protein